MERNNRTTAAGLDEEEWMSMSEEQQDAVLDREMADYAKWYDSLTPLDQYRHRRKRGVKTCLGWRRIIARIDIPVFRDHLRVSQRLLLKMRADFFHGTQGGVQ